MVSVFERRRKRNDVPNRFRRSFSQDRRQSVRTQNRRFPHGTLERMLMRRPAFPFPILPFWTAHTMLPSTRNGSGTLRSDIYYTTVFRVVKLVWTNFFQKSFPSPCFHLKFAPLTRRIPSRPSVPPASGECKRRFCDYSTWFTMFYTHFSQKIDTVSHSR